MNRTYNSKYELAAIALESMERLSSASLEINPQKSYYQSIYDYLKENNDLEELENIDESKPLYVLQVYPRTPIGFNIYYAQDFCECVNKAKKDIHNESNN